jgi:hypothetical protein
LNAVALVQFFFIVLVPLLIVAGTLAGLFALGALFDLMEHPGEARSRVEGLFRRPPAPPRPTDKGHFYQAYWQRADAPTKTELTTAARP